VSLSNGQTLMKEKRDYEGCSGRPMPWEDAVRKFERLSLPYTDPALRQEIAAAVAELESISAADLVRLLARVRVPGRPSPPSALAGVLLATLIRVWLHPLLGNQYPFPTFFVASMVTAWYAGLGPALLSLMLGCLAGIYSFVPPTTPWTATLLGTSIFAFVAVT